MTSNLQEIMRRTIDGMEPKHVFGEPIERDGALFLPVAKVTGGGEAAATPMATAVAASA